jgi:hypothetical protein
VIFHQKYRENFGETFLENFFGLIFGKLCEVLEITKWEKKPMVMGFPTTLICWSFKLIQGFFLCVGIGEEG